MKYTLIMAVVMLVVLIAFAAECSMFRQEPVPTDVTGRWIELLFSTVDCQIELGDLIIAIVTAVYVFLTYSILKQNRRQLDLIIEGREKDKVMSMIRHFIEPIIQNIKRNITIFNERHYEWKVRAVPVHTTHDNKYPKIKAVDNENTIEKLILNDDFELNIEKGTENFRIFSRIFLNEHADIERKIKYYNEKASIIRGEFEDLLNKMFTQHLKNKCIELVEQSKSPIRIDDFPDDEVGNWIIDELLMDEEKFIDKYKKINEEYKEFYQEYGNKLLNEIDNESIDLAKNIINLSVELEKYSNNILDELQEIKLNYMRQYPILESNYREKPRPVIA